MRELIEPALKIMARTGLFLSVVAWVVGQWWTASVTTSTNSTTAAAGFGRTAVYAGVNSGRPRGMFIVAGYDGPYLGNRWLSDQWTDGLHKMLAAEDEYIRNAYTPLIPKLKRDRQMEEIVRTPAYVVWSGRQPGIRVYHYLIVSTFTIFNVALWWFYRKPKEVTPCES